MTETTLPPVALEATDAASLRAAGRRVREATARRDELIREAAAAGASYREIAEAVGLSHTAVAFIVRGRRAR